MTQASLRGHDRRFQRHRTFIRHRVAIHKALSALIFQSWRTSAKADVAFRARIILIAVAPLMAWTCIMSWSRLSHDLGALLASFGGAAFFALAGMASAWVVGGISLQRPARARSRTLRYPIEGGANDLLLRFCSDPARNHVSPAIKTLLGYGGDGGATISLRKVIHPDDRHRVVALYRSLAPEAPCAAATMRLRHRTGALIHVEAAFLRLDQQDGDVDIVIMIKNVTDRHHEAETLRLMSEAARLAQADANEASKAKTEFLARMSHEIRTPLNSITGFAALLLDIPMLPPKAHRYGTLIKGAGNALLTIVNDILDFSEVESGTLELKPKACALPLLIDDCFSIVHQAALAKQLALDVAIMDRLPAGVLCDEARLRQVLLNLLNNAIKFTMHGSIRLEIRYDRTQDRQDRVKFSIIDTGIGIADEEIARLFQRFRQVDGTNRRTYGGTGLGLAICKQLVTLMGGEIGVTSEKGSGSTFWFTLDLPAAPLVLQVDSKPAYRPQRSLTILVAEDVPLNQELIRVILEAGGHAVDLVGDGADAIMAVQDRAYDVVLMDIQMPHIDGLTATRTIRNLPAPCRDVPIIAMTANVLPEHARLARAAGMNDVVHKPFTAREVYDILDAMPKTEPTVSDQAVLDWATVLKLASFIGEAKVKSLMACLVTTMAARFGGDPTTPDGRAALRRDAHATVAGAGMLGFKTLSLRCSALETAEDDDLFEAVLITLKDAMQTVAALATTIATDPAPLAPQADAA